MKMEQGRNYTWDQIKIKSPPQRKKRAASAVALSFIGAPCTCCPDKNLKELQNAALPTRVEIMAQHLK